EGDVICVPSVTIRDVRTRGSVCAHCRQSEGRDIEPLLNRLRAVVRITDEVRPLISAAHVGPVETSQRYVDRLSGLRAHEAVHAPTAEYRIGDGIPRSAVAAPFAEWQVVHVAEIENVPEVDAGAPVVAADIVRILRLPLGE